MSDFQLSTQTMEYIDFHTHRPTAEGVISPRSFGIHPWKADDETCQTYEAFAAAYDRLFSETDLVGECGLDKVCSASFTRQLQLFQWQIRIAEQLQKPMVIHCVRAFNELIALRKEHPEGIWVVHGFIGTTQLAEQLFRAAVWPSFGAAILDPRRTKVRGTLSDFRHPFFLETDDSLCDIRDIYAAAADIRNIPLAEVCHTIKNHYDSLLNK